MGASFSPSVVNILMAHWKADVVFQDKPQQFRCYRCFIDNVFMIWKGDKANLLSFMRKL